MSRLISSRVCLGAAALRSHTLRVARPAVVPSAGLRHVHLVADHAQLKDQVPQSGSEPFKVELSEESFKYYRIDPIATELTVTKDELVHLYSEMVKMRRMEVTADQAYKNKLVRGFCHLSIGQEAVAVGMETAIRPDDSLITAYRCHTFLVQRGGTIKGMLAELFGREDGSSRGKGGSMHVYAPNFFGGNGIVGAQVPLGAGLAFAQKYNKTGHATFTLYGDGASNQGQAFEAFNMAKLWNLPCVFICENNKYGMGTSAERSSMNTQFYTRGDVIPGIQVNAMDVLAVKRGTEFAREYTTSGNGPLLMELVTYRYGGHSLSDPGTTYRTREEIQKMRSSSDPIQGLKTQILDWGVIEEDELKKVDKAAKEEVDKAFEEAKASKEPSVEELCTNIYVDGTGPTWVRGREREEIHHC
ncbi:E1 alpha subunit of the pyruvate dehydrogenase (PDH) complex [Malassezia sympodialis ATCC 42132]|uniref:Pyruvate dehydrogenase E1 component subunit alpha n=2 Tax=Malassezia sympodialis (strain ATCC 42132) TaxID=1230383 RepID=A0A1M8A014_MALS4|nr:E1 alpha subunit of the pyruvate dehydrogenase (PDH) complex [Malassezia sympodialis ATCC 42132]